MKLTVNTKEKTIRVNEPEVKFTELLKVLNQLFPKGGWRGYKLKTTYYYSTPVWNRPWQIISESTGKAGLEISSLKPSMDSKTDTT